MKAQAILIATLACSSAAAARDYGQMGTVFPIIETDLLSVIETRLVTLKTTGRFDQLNQEMVKKAEAKIRRPQPVAGLSETLKPRSWDYDPSIIVDHDVRDLKGHLIVAAGKRINPLDFIVIKQPLVFVDGDNDRQMAWAIAHYRGSLAAKIILVNGAPLEAMKAYQNRFYFDQGGALVAKFGISHTPALVEQAGRVMRVAEVVLPHTGAE